MSRRQDRKMTYNQLEQAYRQAVHELARVETDEAGASGLLNCMDDMLHALSTRSGYVRIGIDYRLGTYWARWKWTTGDYAGHYIFASSPRLDEALGGLFEKKSRVDAGKLRPSYDQAYRPHARRTD